MKARFIIPLAAMLVFGAPVAFAQTAGTGAQQGPITQQMQQRFGQMSTMMGQAQNAHGAQRLQLMQEHIQLMREQMQAMRSMMGGGQMGGAGMMGRTDSGGGKGDADMLNQMQTRMDMMQRMMEQMLDQQQMMMPSVPSK